MGALTRLATLVTLFLTCSAFAATAPIPIAVEDAAAPWSQKDGTGYANDVVTEAFKAIGIEISFIVVPYARAKHMAVEGEVAACFSMSPDPELRDAIVLSDKPLFSLHSDYFQNVKKPLKASSEKEFAPGVVIGDVIGYEYPASVAELKKRGIILDSAKDEDTNLKKLALGRVDAALINHNDQKSASSTIAAAGATGLVEFAFRSGDMDAYIGFSKKNAQGEFARKTFNRGFELISNNGTLQRINEKWYAKRPENKPPTQPQNDRTGPRK